MIDLITKEELIDKTIATSYTRAVKIKQDAILGSINTYLFCEPGKNSTDSLGKSISLMSDADLVVFAPGWEDARGCRIEHQVARDYGIQVSYY